MPTPLTVQDLDEQILQLKEQLLALGPVHPGSLSQQYHVCGKPGCQCGDPQKPRPHGPYAKLTYVHHGKYTCRFVRAESIREVTALLAGFKTFRRLTDRWVTLSIQRAQLGPLQRTARKSPPATRAQQAQQSPRRPNKGR